MVARIVFTEGLHSDPIAWSVGTPAIGLWTLSITYVTREQADLIYPRSEAERWEPDLQSAPKLVEHGLWARVDDGWWVLNPALQRTGKQAWRVEVPRNRVPADVRLAVFARDGHRCVECGATDDLTLDHIWPWSRGGRNEASNLRVLCRSCNSAKGARV